MYCITRVSDDGVQLQNQNERRGQYVEYVKAEENDGIINHVILDLDVIEVAAQDTEGRGQGAEEQHLHPGSSPPAQRNERRGQYEPLIKDEPLE